MAICSPSQNTSPPPWARVLTAGEVTPQIQKAAAGVAYDGSIPIGFQQKGWVSGLPILVRCECHTYTVGPDGSQTPGLYHGATVYLITDPAQYPPKDGGPTPPGGPEQIDWFAIGSSAAAIVVVCTLFAFALKHAGRASVIRPAYPRLRERRQNSRG